jgi:NAD(P)-dependent dehydrogenase (short-subunit alcohol dehydrogenase family)
LLLRGKVAVIHGGAGAIGSAVARAFAYEGARVFLAGRTRANVDRVAGQIAAAGGKAEAAEVDALDERAVDAHADAVAADAGSIDIALNAIGVMHVQGVAFADLSVHDFEHPVGVYTRSNFLTARAAARHMVKRRAGVILTLSTPGARLSGSGFMGNGVASGAVETFSRILAGELGASGVRVVCLRPDAIPQATATSHTGQVFAGMAASAGMTVDGMLAERARTAPLLKRLPTLADVAHFATFVASDRAGAMTGVIANLSCGSLVD